MKDDRCKIEVSIPEDADLHKLEEAIKKALKTKRTAEILDCNEITIILRRHSGS